MTLALEKINTIDKKLFGFFDEVFLFGSSITSTNPNDIDILLIYDEYSPEITNQKSNIEKAFHRKLGSEIPLHFTVLSKKELSETKFLTRIKSFHKISD